MENRKELPQAVAGSRVPRRSSSSLFSQNCTARFPAPRKSRRNFNRSRKLSLLQTNGGMSMSIYATLWALQFPNVLEIRAAVVGHRVILPISPDAFDRIELRGIRGQGLEGYLTVLGLDMLAHEFGAMGLQALPDDKNLLADGLLQGLQELNNLWTFDRAIEQTEVESPAAQACNNRQLLPTKAVLQDRSLPFGGPSARATRSLRRT